MTKKDQNCLEIILEREYESIADILNCKVIGPLAFDGKPIDKTILSMASKDLDEKLNSQEMNVVQPKIRSAYSNLKNLVNALDGTNKKEIKRNLKVMKELNNLLTSCDIHGSLISDGTGGIYFGSNPCKDEQYSLSSALSEARNKGAQYSKLLDAVDGVLRTCSDCPYKILSEK
jgi:hypothetical protein